MTFLWLLGIATLLGGAFDQEPGRGAALAITGFALLLLAFVASIVGFYDPLT